MSNMDYQFSAVISEDGEHVRFVRQDGSITRDWATGWYRPGKDHMTHYDSEFEGWFRHGKGTSFLDRAHKNELGSFVIEVHAKENNFTIYKAFSNEELKTPGFKPEVLVKGAKAIQFMGHDRLAYTAGNNSDWRLLNADGNVMSVTDAFNLAKRNALANTKKR